MFFKFAEHESPIEVLLECSTSSSRNGYRYRIGDRSGEIEIERIAPQEGWLQSQGAVAPYYLTSRNGRVLVWIAGRSYDLEIVDGGPRRTQTRSHRPDQRSERLTAPMPGTILQIVTRLGDSFEAHQPLVIMESMKMELTLSVPHAGRVREILCHEGQLVEMGAPLVRLEAE